MPVFDISLPLNLLLLLVLLFFQRRSLQRLLKHFWVTWQQHRPRRKEQNEREIAHWEARTSETEKIALELALCVEAIDKINQLWELGDDENKQGMARNLFSYIVYDLDIQRIAGI